MYRRSALMLTGALAATASLGFCFICPALAQTLTPQQQLAFDILKELVEINTSTDNAIYHLADGLGVRTIHGHV